MKKKLSQEQIEMETEQGFTGPVRQRRASPTSAKRSRMNARRKVKPARQKRNKIGGIHQRSNHRSGW